MKNPYEVLGISPSATNEEVRDAYRALAKKYHPDNYVDSPLADMAEEKMKEINAAYDEILRIRTEQKNSSEEPKRNTGYANYGAYGSQTSKVRRAINEGDYTLAEKLLNEVEQRERDAEWFFLKGLVLLHSDYYFDAMRYINRACELAPNNQEYATLRDNLNAQSRTFGDPSARPSSGCGICDMCPCVVCPICMC